MGELFERVRPVRPLEWTGERFTTNLTGQIEVEHLHRYFLARHLTRGVDVLDIASGEGYGSSFLAQTAHSVIGVEIDRVAVEHARAAYVAQNLHFVQGSAQSIPLPDQSIDCVVSFETIEHLHDQQQFLTEIRRVLRPGGKLIVSSPNCDVYSPTGAQPNPYHIRELTRNEFEKLLRANFEHVTLLAQRPIVGSVIVRVAGADSSFNNMTFENRGGDRYEASQGLDGPLYYLAFASDIPLSSIPESFYFERGSVDDVMITLPALRLEHQRIQESLNWLRAEHLRLKNNFGFRLGRFLGRITSWNKYDAVYQVWKEYKKQHIDRHEALKIIGDEYGVRSFFLLYPLYTAAKPFLKCKRFIGRKL